MAFLHMRRQRHAFGQDAFDVVWLGMGAAFGKRQGAEAQMRRGHAVAHPPATMTNEFAAPGAPQMDFVFTVCDNAAGEVCPFWPGQPMTAHWGVPDPAAVDGSDDEKAQAFVDAAVTLKRRIELMLALPLPSLDSQRIAREIRHIGTR